MSFKRYRMVDVHNDEESWSELKENKDGEFVLFKDYTQLESEKAELFKFIQNLHYGLSCGRVATLRELENILQKHEVNK